MSAGAEATSGTDESEEAREPSGSGVERDAPLCDLCGHPMVERHCKLVCLRCGYQRDCSDP